MVRIKSIPKRLAPGELPRAMRPHTGSLVYSHRRDYANRFAYCDGVEAPGESEPGSDSGSELAHEEFGPELAHEELGPELAHEEFATEIARRVSLAEQRYREMVGEEVAATSPFPRASIRSWGKRRITAADTVDIYHEYRGIEYNSAVKLARACADVAFA